MYERDTCGEHGLYDISTTTPVQYTAPYVSYRKLSRAICTNGHGRNITNNRTPKGYSAVLPVMVNRRLFRVKPPAFWLYSKNRWLLSVT
jgi:hypothetical protein